MEPGHYQIKIRKDVGVGGGLPPYWFWSVSFDYLKVSNVAFTKWGAKRAAIKYIASREKSFAAKEITYDIKF